MDKKLAVAIVIVLVAVVAGLVAATAAKESSAGAVKARFFETK